MVIAAVAFAVIAIGLAAFMLTRTHFGPPAPPRLATPSSASTRTPPQRATPEANPAPTNEAPEAGTAPAPGMAAPPQVPAPAPLVSPPPAAPPATSAEANRAERAPAESAQAPPAERAPAASAQPSAADTIEVPATSVLPDGGYKAPTTAEPEAGPPSETPRTPQSRSGPSPDAEGGEGGQ